MRQIGTQPLETNRLLLRRMHPDDAAAMYRNWAGDAAVTRWLRWDPHPNAAHTRRLLAAWEELYANPDYYQWGIVEKATGTLFGSISLYDSAIGEGCRPALWRTPGLDFSAGIWEPGYCIGRAWWNRGYTTEALRAVVRYWFSGTDSTWLACSHAAANPASGRVMQKAGFVYDHSAQYHKFDGTAVDCRVYSLTRSAWAVQHL